ILDEGRVLAACRCPDQARHLFLEGRRSTREEADGYLQRADHAVEENLAGAVWQGLRGTFQFRKVGTDCRPVIVASGFNEIAAGIERHETFAAQQALTIGPAGFEGIYAERHFRELASDIERGVRRLHVFNSHLSYAKRLRARRGRYLGNASIRR